MKTLSRIIYFYPIIKKSRLFFIGVSILSFLPLMVAAKPAAGPVVKPSDTLSAIGLNFLRLSRRLVTLVFVLSVLLFGWGIVKFVAAAGSDDVKKAKQFLLWGVIGMAVGVSLFGLITFLQNYFGISNARLIINPPVVL